MGLLHRTVTWHDGSGHYHFASVDDGETWLEINRKPEPDDEDQVAALFGPTVNPDTGTRTGPLVFAKRYFTFGGDAWTATEPERIA